MQAEHADALLRAAAYASIWAVVPRPFTTLAEAHTYIDNAVREAKAGREAPFVIVDQAAGTVVGSTRYLDIDSQNRSLEIGSTWLAPSVWRTSINTECKYLLLRHAFESLDIIRVQLKTDLRNLLSQKAIERIGAVREGVLRHHRILPGGILRDSVYYSILAEEWPAVRQRLEAFLNAPH